MKAINRKILTAEVVKGALEPKPLVAESMASKPRMSLLKRPSKVYGMTYKIKPPGADHAMYVTFNYMSTSEGNKPIEMFINSKDPSHLQWIMTVTRLVSAIFRNGNYDFVVEELNAVFAADGGYWKEGGNGRVNSTMHHIGQCLEEFLDEISSATTGEQVLQEISSAPENGDLADVAEAAIQAHVAEATALQAVTSKRQCPKCNYYSMISKGGCWECEREKCGHSSCEDS